MRLWPCTAPHGRIRSDSPGPFKHGPTEGVNAYREAGHEGIIRWLNAVDYWMHKYRKRCPPRVRAFINFFSYQAKVSFYVCYANFWASLIPWLQQNHGLDEISTRFLRMWHNQNQPIEIPPWQNGRWNRVSDAPWCADCVSTARPSY